MLSLWPMRITVAHNKGQKEAMRLVDETSDQLLRPDVPGMLRMVDIKKNWVGNTMNFSMAAKLGFISTPLHGTVVVADKDVVIEIELPAFLTKLFPETSIRSGIETKIKGLLT
ncbi:MAG: polyhydroxyalkanoic acid system family protein [Acidobacteriota bacterium]|nr:polyhydroxyalkanoic acid system family protein [Acidobacteriota bacterium]